MSDQNPSDIVIPVLSEELHAEAVPVEKGGIRVTKRVEGHDEVIQQEIRKGRVDVKRIAVNRPTAGPEQPRREGNTLIIPVTSEILRIEKQWMVTEEIHLTQIEESQTVTEKVPVNQEVATVQRIGEDGGVVSEIAATRQPGRVLSRPLTQEPERKILSRINTGLVKKS